MFLYVPESFKKLLASIELKAIFDSCYVKNDQRASCALSLTSSVFYKYIDCINRPHNTTKHTLIEGYFPEGMPPTG